MTPYRLPYPVPGVVWASLPLPALLIGPDNRIAEVNPAAEIFLNSSTKSLMGHPAFDRLSIDAPMDEALARARANQSPLFINDVDVTTGERAPVQCNIQVAPMHDNAEVILMVISPRDIADRLGRAMHVKSAAKSAIGMAEMLAHEIKNPLAGISGAAQLIAMNLSAEDRELADLIVEETRRIVKLLEQVEQFGNIRPPDRRPVNIHDALDRARKSAVVGFAAHMNITEDYDPSLPPTYADADQLMQVFLNLIKNARAKGARSVCTHSTICPCACAAKMAAPPPCHSRSKSSTTARVSRRKSPPTFSNPSSRAAKTAPVWGSPSFPRSFPTTKAGFLWIRCPVAPCSACPCPWSPRIRRSNSDGWNRPRRR